jgi:hypothetical protein
MPMQARALVSGRYVRQPVRGLDVKNLEDVHGQIVHTRLFVRRVLVSANKWGTGFVQPNRSFENASRKRLS